MNINCIKLYLYFRFYQYIKIQDPDITIDYIIANYKSSCFILRDRDNDINFNINISEKEIIENIKFERKTLFQKLFYSQLQNAKNLKQKLDVAIFNIKQSIIAKEFDIEEFKINLINLKFIFLYRDKLPSLNHDFFKIYYENIILRAFCSNDESIINIVIKELNFIRYFINIDYLMLYTLTKDERFNLGDFHLDSECNIWDYITAISDDSNYKASENLGKKIMIKALKLEHDNLEKISIKKHELAVAAYWLCGTEHGKEIIQENCKGFFVDLSGSGDIKFNLEKRKRIINKQLLKTEKTIEDSKDKTSLLVHQAKCFAMRLARNDCPVTLNPFISFKEIDAIIKLDTYQDITDILLNKKLAACKHNIYEKKFFADWVLTHKKDIIDRSVNCNTVGKISGRYDCMLLRRFLNAKRLIETDILNYISNDWFSCNKILSLLTLEPGLYSPEWLRSIERIGVANLNSRIIILINNYFVKYKSLPVEVMNLCVNALGDFRCNFNSNLIDKSLIKLFDEYNYSSDAGLIREEISEETIETIIIRSSIVTL